MDAHPPHFLDNDFLCNFLEEVVEMIFSDKISGVILNLGLKSFFPLPVQFSLPLAWVSSFMQKPSLVCDGKNAELREREVCPLSRCGGQG